MARVTVPVLKPLTHQGRSYVRGESLECEAAEASALARRGAVSLTKGYRTRDLVAAGPEPVPVRTRRQYRRRDMTAKASAE